jgi:hypothetical protein
MEDGWTPKIGGWVDPGKNVRNGSIRFFVTRRITMSLFVVHHKHEAEICPARDPQMASMLLKHLSPANADNYGIKIEGEAVIKGAHRLYLILEAPDEESVNRFMQPFAQAGNVEILAGSSCEEVVKRGVC